MVSNVVAQQSKTKSWKKYSREMAASIITFWSLKMISKMRDEREALSQDFD